MLDFLLVVTVATIIFFAVDMVWLGLIAKKLYAKELKKFLSPEVNWIAAIIFYVIFILGLSFFAITPALNGEGLLYAVLAGAFFGFVCYSTYDLTNLATIKNWPLKITLIDLAWGAFICSVTSTLTYLLLI
jgi:uncharacterized membrane protein